jgi:hypothetical protein
MTALALLRREMKRVDLSVPCVPCMVTVTLQNGEIGLSFSWAVDSSELKACDLHDDDPRLGRSFILDGRYPSLLSPDSG